MSRSSTTTATSSCPVSPTTSRYAPYAGICIDPFCDPAKAFDTYPGLGSEYLESAGSSAISIERCTVSNFVVGIAIAPNGVTQNAEDISIDNCIVTSTKSAIAVCQDQSRGVSCRNLNVTYAKYVIDCTHYGKGSGDCPSIFNAVISTVKYVFNTYSFGSGTVLD